MNRNPKKFFYKNKCISLEVLNPDMQSSQWWRQVCKYFNITGRAKIFLMLIYGRQIKRKTKWGDLGFNPDPANTSVTLCKSLHICRLISSFDVVSLEFRSILISMEGPWGKRFLVWFKILLPAPRSVTLTLHTLNQCGSTKRTISKSPLFIYLQYIYTEHLILQALW